MAKPLLEIEDALAKRRQIAVLKRGDTQRRVDGLDHQLELPKGELGVLLLDVRYAVGVKDEIDDLDAFLGQFDNTRGERINNGVIHNKRAKAVCGLLVVDQHTIVESPSGTSYFPNPLKRCKTVESLFGMIGVPIRVTK